MKSQNAPSKSKPAPTSRAPRKVSQFINAWKGQTPEQVLPGIDAKDIPGIATEVLLNKEIIIHGFSKRVGEFGDFDLVLATMDKDTFVFTCGGAVVRRKLDTIAEDNGFPVIGRIVKPEGKNYYDLI